MKITQLLPLVISIVFLSLSCTKEKTVIKETPVSENSGTAPCPNVVTYPVNGFYGVNILAVQDSSIIIATNSYSFSANLDCDASLKVIINGDNGALWQYISSSSQGWNIGSFSGPNPYTQTFQSNTTGTLELSFALGGSGNSPGGAIFDFYENGSSTITFSKYISWQ